MGFFVALVPKAGLEPARLAAGDFESPASTELAEKV